jgi:hypothetical protein
MYTLAPSHDPRPPSYIRQLVSSERSTRLRDPETAWHCRTHYSTSHPLSSFSRGVFAYVTKTDKNEHIASTMLLSVTYEKNGQFFR